MYKEIINPEEKSVLIMGATGMVGSEAVKQCLAHKKITRVVAIVRKATGIKDERFTEVLHDNFLDYSEISSYFHKIDLCLYCLGVYWENVSMENFRLMTFHYVKAFSLMLYEHNPKMFVCYLSARDSDRTGMHAKPFYNEKGAAENWLFSLPMKNVYTFKPGYIFPGFKRKEASWYYTALYYLFNPVFKPVDPNYGLTVEQLVKVMLKVGFKGYDKFILENEDILSLYHNIPLRLGQSR